MSFEEVQWALIRGHWPKDLSRAECDAVSLAHDAAEGKFTEVLTSPFAKTLFTVDISESKCNLAALFTFDMVATPEHELSRLCVGFACLHAFIQLNWTGPNLDLRPTSLVTSSSASESFSDEALNQMSIIDLAYGGEPAYHLATHPIFLRWALLVFSLPYKHTRTAPWWKLRATIIHQNILDDPAPLPPSFLAELEPLALYLDNQSHPDLLGRLILEQGLLHHLFGNDRSAAEHFVRAARATGLEYELTGALGKRTKFQQTELSQLVLLAESRKRDDDEGSLDPASAPSPGLVAPVPDTLALNDDTLLEQTEFTSSQPGQSATSRLSHLAPSSQPPLDPLDQCILLSLCLNIKNTSPSHGLTAEQMMPYVSRVMSHPRNWSVHTMALLLRSRLESTRTRTVERSTLQLQALIEQMPTADSALPERLRYVHNMPLPSKWQLERELAMRFLGLGVVKSALEIFERLEMWEEVVKCWQAMERPDKGLAIVRDLLEGRKEEAGHVVSKGKVASGRLRLQRDRVREAKLWCLLGDLEPKHAHDHYQRAWAVSNETSGRAMRSLGGYHFARNDFEQAVGCLRLAVAINPMLPRTWFILGCAHLRLESWDAARDAFARCVAIDDEDGESWSNLASVYLRMGAAGMAVDDPSTREAQEDLSVSSLSLASSTTNAIPFSNKMLAFRALRQGLKFSYENWRMWANYMVVAVEVGELAEAARAVSRVVEERSGKDGTACVDEDVIERLVDAVTRVPADQPAEGRNPNEGHGLLPRVLDLFVRTLLPRVSSPRIFRAYARLLMWQGRWADALKAHLDAYRSGMAGQMVRGETDVSKWRGAVGEVEEMVDMLRNFGPRVEGSRWIFQAQSILRTFMGKTKDFDDEADWTRLVCLQEELRNET